MDLKGEKYNVEDIKEVRKDSFTKEVLFKRSSVSVDSLKENNLYIIFGIQKVCDDYGIDYEECLMMMYLYELGLFGLQLSIESRRFNLGDYLLKDLICEDYSHKRKKLYRLSKLGNSIVNQILKSISDVSMFSTKNRSCDLEVDLKLKNTISSYLNQ